MKTYIELTRQLSFLSLWSNKTKYHVIFECDLYSHKAFHFRSYLRNKYPNSPENIFPFLSPPSKLCRLLLAFMKISDRFF